VTVQEPTRELIIELASQSEETAATTQPDRDANADGVAKDGEK
jgi:hypothetical protein